MIEKGDVGDADRSRGRFRTFLLTACQHYLLNERDRVSAAKRGGGRPPLSIDPDGDFSTIGRVGGQ